VADDNRDSAESLALFLEAHGHRVHVAYDGETAIAEANALVPEVAFIDIGMPKLSGYEVARALRQTPWGGSVHLVAVTGWGQDSDRRRARDVGFDAHLVKPATPEVLLGILAAMDALPGGAKAPAADAAPMATATAAAAPAATTAAPAATTAAPAATTAAPAADPAVAPTAQA
jgi:CheY-like chemotaxis protein